MSWEECVEQLMEAGFDKEDAEMECDFLTSDTEGGCDD